MFITKKKDFFILKYVKILFSRSSIDDRYSEQQRILAIGNLVHENPKITRLNLNLILNILFDVPGKSLYFFPGISVSTL